ncbi:hypothetical protein NliqN6_2187 [Naganishia liquefaciens]|uniref:Uncharacterized protein n=1 Tax=Naganishia liquefaciens TaxID=104408 RepID=A0A8H3TSF0_9TREE|nr:hypothetical protein NliqN6_2187 [Naganishia liquefaciens]
MAQHSTKGLKAKAAAGGKKNTGKTKKGARWCPPKSNDKIQHVARQKKLSTNINNNIERQMIQAASAGKLTIMRNAGGEPSTSKDGKGKGKAAK